MPEFFFDKRLYYTPIEFALSHLGGTWKMPILWLLQEKPLRFNELKKDIPHITDEMLTSQLRELEIKGMVNREIFPVIPPKVEYTLTSKEKRPYLLLKPL